MSRVKLLFSVLNSAETIRPNGRRAAVFDVVRTAADARAETLMDNTMYAILEEEIVGVVTQEDGKPVKRNTLYLKKDKGDGRISMRIAPKELSGFGGNYTLYVDLTENEVAKLFWECFPQIRDVIFRLHGLEALAEAHKANVEAHEAAAKAEAGALLGKSDDFEDL
jgi:hypothetical protein